MAQIRIGLLVAAGALLGTTVLVDVAAAEIAYTVGDTKIRSGPSTNHRVIGGVLAGARINVHECTSRWCLMSARGVEGWIARSGLDFVQSVPRVQQGPTIQFGFGFGGIGRPGGRNSGGPGMTNAGAPGMTNAAAPGGRTGGFPRDQLQP